MITPDPGRWTGAISVRSSILRLIALGLLLLAAGCSSAADVDIRPTGAVTATEGPSGTALGSTERSSTEPVETSQAEDPIAEAPAGPAPSPSPNPAPTLYRLTSGGCCVQPEFSPDGRQILYIDRPSPEQPAGLWSVSLDGGAPQFFSDQLGIFSADMQFRAFPADGQTVVEHVETEEQWVIPNGGRPVSLSPDGSWLAWTAGETGPPFDTARREVWVSRIDGTSARQVFSAIRGGFSGWLGSDRILVSGRIEDGSGEQAYWALDIEPNGDADPVELGRGGRVREARISTDGSWLAYLVTFSDDPQRNGIWLADTFTGAARRLEVFGGYRWRDEERLLVVPMDLASPDHHLLQIHAPTGELTALTEPGLTPFKIANGDWTVSPSGRHLAFVSAEDANIWLIELPED